MKNIKVLGTGCANCQTTLKMIDEAAKALGVDIVLEKVEELPEIMRYGVMSTPGVVVDGKMVHAGGLPTRQAIESWLKGEGEAESGCCGSSGSSCCG